VSKSVEEATSSRPVRVLSYGVSRLSGLCCAAQVSPGVRMGASARDAGGSWRMSRTLLVPCLPSPPGAGDGVLTFHITHAYALPLRAHRVAIPGAATLPGVPAGDVWWGEVIGTGLRPCRIVRTRMAAPRANSPAVVNATW
jgi:hypothetical protein